MRKKIKDKIKKLYKKSIKYQTDKILKEDLDDVPSLIQNYFRKVQINGKERVRQVRIFQKGHFKMDPNSKWKPFTANQYVNIERMSFLWYAKIKMMPLINIHVIDEFIEEKGALEAKLFNLIPVVSEEGEKLDQGEFLRFISEAPWYPSFFLKKEIMWNNLNNNTLELKLKKKKIEISGNLIFDEQGLIKEFTAKRYYTDRDDIVLKDWHGFFNGYKEFNGILIPTNFKVCWHLESGNYCYIRGEIVKIEYN